MAEGNLFLSTFYQFRILTWQFFPRAYMGGGHMPLSHLFPQLSFFQDPEIFSMDTFSFVFLLSRFITNFLCFLSSYLGDFLKYHIQQDPDKWKEESL